MYIVKYCGGSYEDYYTKDIFVTSNKRVATKYVTKFNKLLKKWTEHYWQYEKMWLGIVTIADEHADRHFTRWNSLQKITKCYYEEIAER